MTMDSALMKFLQEDYPAHLGIEKGQKVVVQRTEYGRGEFDFRDENDRKDEKKEWFSSRIRNESDMPFEVINFEAYIDGLRSDKRVKTKDLGKKCDLVFGPVEGRAFILFNELTYAWKKAIDEPFDNPTTGKREDGKRVKAQKQLAASIDRFYKVGNLLDEYEKKIALFSYRLKDNDHKEEAEANMLSFMKDMNESELNINITGNPLPDGHGFIFEQRLYDQDAPQPYIIEAD